MSRIASRSTILLCIVLLVWSAAVHASGLEKRSRIELRIGLWSQVGETQETTQVGLYGVETTAKSGGTLGALTYAYWVQENLAVNFTLALLAVEASSRVGPLGVSQHAVSVFPVLLGVRYYLPKSTFKTSFRPYLAAGIGPYIGFEAKNEVGLQVVQDSRTMTSFGGYLGGGLDIQLGRYLMVGANVGYNLMMDFSESLGGRDNYNGPEFGVGVSLLFGKGVQPRK